LRQDEQYDDPVEYGKQLTKIEMLRVECDAYREFRMDEARDLTMQADYFEEMARHEELVQLQIDHLKYTIAPPMIFPNTPWSQNF